MRKKDKKRMVYIIVLAIFAVMGIWLLFTNTTITTTRITIENTEIPKEFNEFKIAVVSDLHNRKWGDKLTDRIKSENPDIIVIPGDLVYMSDSDFINSEEFIKCAAGIAPVYYVAGNHECWFNGYDELVKMLEDSGVYIMDNRSELIEKDGAKINIAGLKDPVFAKQQSFIQSKTESFINENYYDVFTENLEQILNKDYYNIVLSHRPEAFEKYAQSDADLVICGHAHGGQVRIPFIGGLIAPDQGFFPKYTEGVYSKNGTDMVVSRGLGDSVVPVRVNNTPELVIINLKNK